MSTFDYPECPFPLSIDIIVNTCFHVNANGCQQCRMTMRLMDKLGIVYTDVNIDDNESICEQLINEGFKQMPVVKADGESWSGYQPDRIKTLIK